MTVRDSTDLMVPKLKRHDHKEVGMWSFYAAFLIQGMLDGWYIVAERQWSFHHSNFRVSCYLQWFTPVVLGEFCRRLMMLAGSADNLGETPVVALDFRECPVQIMNSHEDTVSFFEHTR